MTNKLKTLNEIEDFDCYSEEIHEREIVFVRVNDLRAEAINWLKYERECSNGENKNDWSKDFQMVYHARTWIKTFFNIDESELK